MQCGSFIFSFKHATVGLYADAENVWSQIGGEQGNNTTKYNQKRRNKPPNTIAAALLPRSPLN